MTSPRTWYDRDINLEPLRDEIIAVIGYGIQGSAQANNMKESGLSVILGLRKGRKSWEKAVSDGHNVFDIPDAVSRADIVHFLIPDMEQSGVFKAEVEASLKKGKALGFSHGAAIHWGWIKPPSWVDILLVAPKGPGQRVRELYQQGFGVPALAAVHQDYTGKAWPRVLGMAKAIGAARAMLIETSFKEEVESDWFGEQVDLCGGVHRLIINSFEVLIEAGYKPEIAYYETLHELKLIIDLIQRHGIAGMYRRVSETARHGGLTRGNRVIGPDVKEKMRALLDEIQSGRYAEEWRKAWESDGPNAFEKPLKELDQHPIEIIGRKLRSGMWPSENIV